MNTEPQVLNVPIEDIIPNRFQPRLNFDEDGLKELAASIKEHGIIQPLVLRRLGDKYEIIAGERRYKASKMAGLVSVPAIISNLDDKNSAEVAIVENIQRRDLTAIEEAKSYKALLDKGYLTQDELAKKMGISQSSISNKLRLLTLDDSVQNALMQGKISERHARTLLKLDNKEEQAKWLKTIIDERLTVQNLEKRIKDIVKNEEEKSKEEESLIDVLPPLNENDKKETVIPNKFFNYLEDESANMNTGDIFAPQTFQEEEIEMLDFDTSEDTSKFLIANDAFSKFVDELKSKGYTVEFVKDEKTGELNYTIKIKKES